MAVTREEMRLFALDCLRWSDETDNVSHRDLMIEIAPLAARHFLPTFMGRSGATHTRAIGSAL